MPFGLICSPFLLAVTIKFHLQKEGTPLALHILKNIYVDNVLIGIDSSTEIRDVYEEAKSIFRRAAMNLREWNSNSFESLEFIPSCERSTVGVKQYGSSPNCILPSSVLQYTYCHIAIYD